MADGQTFGALVDICTGKKNKKKIQKFNVSSRESCSKIHANCRQFVELITVTQGSENGVVQRSPESGLAGASVPSGPVVAVGIGMAAVGIGSLRRAFVQIQFAVVADKSQPAFTLIGRHALATVLARLVAHGCHKREDKFSFKFLHPPQRIKHKRLERSQPLPVPQVPPGGLGAD